MLCFCVPPNYWCRCRIHWCIKPCTVCRQTKKFFWRTL